MKKLLCIIIAVLIVAIPLTLLPVGQAFADEADSETTGETTTSEENTDTAETETEPILTEEEIAELLAILEKLKDAQSSEEITDIIKETIFSRMAEWFGEYAEIVAFVINIVISAIIVVLYKKSGKYSLGLLNNNKSVVSAVNANTESNTKMAENNTTILANSEESLKAAKISQLAAEAALEMINKLIEKSNLDSASKAIVTRILNNEQIEKEKVLNE